MSQARLVGVDVGGTKTHVRARMATGAELEAVTLTAAWRPFEQERDPSALLEVVQRVAEVGVGTIVTLGVHGCDTREQCVEFSAALSAHSDASFTVVNDAELLVPAAGFTEGIGLVLGTGSIIVGERRDGGLVTAGGWGWLLGDPGSAAALVRDCARAILESADAQAPGDPLREAIFSAFNVNSARELAYCLTAARDATAWAGKAPAVFEALGNGSTLVQTVVDAQLDVLVRQVEHVIARGATGSHVVIGGGLATGQPAYVACLAERLTQSLPISATVLDEPPVVGALTLADRYQARSLQQHPEEFTRQVRSGHRPLMR